VPEAQLVIPKRAHERRDGSWWPLLGAGALIIFLLTLITAAYFMRGGDKPLPIPAQPTPPAATSSPRGVP
jgi:hypothetical protein